MQLSEYTIAELQRLFDHGEWNSAGLCEAFMKRISEFDASGPRLCSVIELNPNALEIAHALDQERQTSGPRGPIHGVAVLVKDSIDTADKMMTTAGSLAMEGNIAMRDAFIIEIRHLKALGAKIVDPIRSSSLPFFGELELELFRYGLKASLNRYLVEHPRARVRNLEELIRFNKDHASQVMPYFRQEFFEMAQTKGDLTEEAYSKVKDELRRLARTDGIDKALSEHKLDAIIAPTEGSPPFVIDPVVGDNMLRGGCSTPPAVAGYPHITVPAGYVHGLPAGLSFFGGSSQEGKLIGYAYAFEQATQVRYPPRFAETIVL
jgi:Asp-tRNA(Asn)/Glu-tRNA(Gln) amidotransferase A subunit family amidase